MDVKLIYSEERNTWNVFIGAEWYWESEDYESAFDVYCNCMNDQD